MNIIKSVLRIIAYALILIVASVFTPFLAIFWLFFAFIASLVWSFNDYKWTKCFSLVAESVKFPFYPKKWKT